MKPEFSEFSYAFAFTRELTDEIKNQGLQPVATLPNTRQEAKSGADLEMFPGTLGGTMFFQFKTSDRLTGRNAKEWKDYKSSYYRFDIRPDRLSRQHNALKKLTKKYRGVYYAAPAFHAHDDFVAYQLAGTVKDNSNWTPVSVLPKQKVGEKHRITFTGNVGRKWHSEVIDIPEFPPEACYSDIEIRETIDDSYFRRMHETMLEIALAHGAIADGEMQGNADLPIDEVLRELEHLSVAHFGLHMMTFAATTNATQ